ncbi:hypothetical protein ACLOJK_022431 [Asimina triloba]
MTARGRDGVVGFIRGGGDGCVGSIERLVGGVLLLEDEDGSGDLGSLAIAGSDGFLGSGGRANDHGDGGGGWLLVGGEMGFNPSGFGRSCWPRLDRMDPGY